MRYAQPGFVVLVGIVAAALLAAGPVRANEVNFDQHVVHYTVVNTTFLTPEVARAYDVRRSRSRALVNVVVMEKADAVPKPVPAAIEGHAVNLNQQVRHLQFREIREGDAIYHLAEVPVRTGEVLDFKIRIHPAGSDRPLPLNFRQVFFPN